MKEIWKDVPGYEGLYQVSEGAIIREFHNSTEASLKTGVCQRNILQVANKEEYKPGLTRKQAGGFIWELKI